MFRGLGQRGKTMARPAKPIISRKRAATAAADIIEKKGLRAFNLDEVALRLGVKTPSLYYHINGKDELLAEVARLLFSEGKVPEIRVIPDWKEEMVKVCLASWRSILRHPNCAPLLLQFYPRVLLLDAYEHWVHFLTVNGVPREKQLIILEGLDKLTYGGALFAAAVRSKGAEDTPSYIQDRHPYLAEAYRANDNNEEENFLLMVRTYLQAF